jgi:hypothetical protein
MILNRTVMEVQLSPTCSLPAESLAARAKDGSQFGSVFLFEGPGEMLAPIISPRRSQVTRRSAEPSQELHKPPSRREGLLPPGTDNTRAQDAKDRAVRQQRTDPIRKGQEDPVKYSVNGMQKLGVSARLERLCQTPLCSLGRWLALSLLLSSQTWPAFGETTGLRDFYSVLTNCPPIKQLVMEVQYYSPEMICMEFRYQPGAFYARQLSDGKRSLIFPPTSKDESCGYIDSAFWYVEPGRSNKNPTVLTTGVEMKPTKCGSVNPMFERIFSLYTTFAITAEGVNQVRVQGQQVIAVLRQGDPINKLALTTSFALSNGLPVTAQIQPDRIGTVKPIPYNVRYNYDPKSIPLPFPKEIICTIRGAKPGIPETPGLDLEKYGEDVLVLHMLVKAITVADHSTRISSDMFMPSSAVLGSKYEHIVITNGQRFIVEGTRWTSMGAAGRALGPDDAGRASWKRWIIICLMVTFCILPIAFRAIQKTRTLTRGKHNESRCP